ncbi:heavy metal translocating P-type ATPase [Staphylococcus hyicus]|uniref:heavy metal translocating P-type ATPase n=1 Tax=Staphylococcus hyicus TaxID=1284 RepID=UPI001F416E47|nr:heavy metal translocating P-type ATPase [Staphylococcus hyicus]MCE5153127.1 heavy metal translocating P-type ATPase [Staphylococcus hyicus]
MKQHTYNVEGLSCAHCANKFEHKLNQLDSVQMAQVNFGASKIYITGKPTLDELEEAGAFENLKITETHPRHSFEQSSNQNQDTQSLTLWQKCNQFYEKNGAICFATLLIILGYLSKWSTGEHHIITIVIFATSIVISGASLLKQGFKNLMRLEFDMHTLMTVAVIGGALIGEWGEVAVVVILFALSEALESFTMDKARQSMQSLINIRPETACRLIGDDIEKVDVNDVNINDVLLIKPGQKIPLDGIIQKGESSINQAAITGESVPVDKVEGDEVFAGTLNESGVLEVLVTKHSTDSTLSKMIQMVERAQVNKAPAQALIEKFAKYYTPLIMLIALCVAIIPPLLFNGEWHAWIYQGLSVLVIGCPCALVIATPIAIISSVSNAAKHGVLIKGGIHLEQLNRIKAIALDKTGTLTQGHPEVSHIEMLNSDINRNVVLQHIGAIETMSTHPIARAVVSYIQKEVQIPPHSITHFQSQTGLGVSATIDNAHYCIGKPQRFNLKVDALWRTKVMALESSGHTVILVSKNDVIIMLIALKDRVRMNASMSCERLKKMGFQHIEMLTGDNEATAKSIAQDTGVTHFKANQLPQDKMARISELKQQYRNVAMVGDGVNDAPALADATIGIAMGAAGTDTAIETADIAILNDDISKLPYTFKLSRHTMRIIKINILIAIGLKVAALLLVIPGWLTLWIAIFSDMGATLLVGLNALRLLYVKPE